MHQKYMLLEFIEEKQMLSDLYNLIDRPCLVLTLDCFESIETVTYNCINFPFTISQSKYTAHGATQILVASLPHKNLLDSLIVKLLN